MFISDSNGQIIVYGGTNINNAVSKPQLLILDTSKIPFTWILQPRADIIDPPLRSHTADIFGDYMIITFGKY